MQAQVETSTATLSAPVTVKSENSSRAPSPLSTQPTSPNSKPPSPSTNKDPSQPTCSNCSTQTTPLWRRSEEGILCNACALYQKMKGCPRPVSLKTDTIKHRNRSKGTKKEKATKDSMLKSAPKGNAGRSSSSARKSLPGGADMDDRDSSYDESSFMDRQHPQQRSMSKRRKRDTPDSEPSPPPPESMFPPQAVLGEQALQQYAFHVSAATASRSSSADTRNAPLPSRYTMHGRSPSQPAFPYHPGLAYQQIQSHYGAFGMPMVNSNTFGRGHASWSQAMEQPQSSGGPSGSVSTVSLPPIRSLTEGIDSESRGRQRERMALPPMSGMSQSDHTATRDPSQASSRASTVTGASYHLGSVADGSLGDHSFPQSDSRRPHDALSESSEGSNGPDSPRSSFQSPYTLPSAVASPRLGPVPDSAACSQQLNGSFGMERRGRSVTRRVENEIGNRIEALRVHDGAASRSQSPRPSQRAVSRGASANAPLDATSVDSALWRSSRSRSRASPSPPEGEEVNKLRMRVNELELINSLLVSRLSELEASRRPSMGERNSSSSRSFSNLPPAREDAQGELRAAAMEQG